MNHTREVKRMLAELRDVKNAEEANTVLLPYAMSCILHASNNLFTNGVVELFSVENTQYFLDFTIHLSEGLRAFIRFYANTKVLSEFSYGDFSYMHYPSGPVYYTHTSLPNTHYIVKDSTANG